VHFSGRTGVSHATMGAPGSRVPGIVANQALSRPVKALSRCVLRSGQNANTPTMSATRIVATAT
jgi:hypothetical protein